LDPQTQQLRQGARYRPHRARYAWWERHLRRISRNPPRDEPRGGQYLRGNPRRPRLDPRTRTDREPRFFRVTSHCSYGTDIDDRPRWLLGRRALNRLDADRERRAIAQIGRQRG